MAKQPEVSYDDVLDRIEGATALVELLCDQDQTTTLNPETISRSATVIRRELVEASMLYTRLCEASGIVRKQPLKGAA